VQFKLKDLKWNIIAPAGLLAVALLAVVWFDFTTGGEAKPPPLLGAIGTPVRSEFTEVPPTEVIRTPTPPARSSDGNVSGTPEERDDRRRADLLLIYNGFLQLGERDGEFPSTGGNTQTLCVFTENDVGCKVSDIIGDDLPSDPLGDPANNGYFYRSDGQAMQVYAQLETDIPAEQECSAERPGLTSRENLICLTASADGR
jgi:hypothetical protein